MKPIYKYISYLTFILVLCFACKTPLKTAKLNLIREENKDVVALSYLIQDYLLQTDNTNFSLLDISKYDTLGNITSNFSSLEVANWPDVWAGGHIVYFKFSPNRNKNLVVLTESQKKFSRFKTKENIGSNKKQLSQKYDGEIHFSYPEKFYHFTAIIFKK